MESRQNPFDIENGDIKISYDAGHALAEYLDLDDLVTCGKVSVAWSRFFNEDLLWKRQLKKDFSINSSMFENLCANKKLQDLTAKAVYAWLKHITNCPYRMPAYAKHLVKHTLHGELLVAIATDDTEKLLSLITPEEQPQWYEVALYAGCKNIPFRLYIEQQQGVVRADYFAKAILAGHEEMYEYITKRNRASLAPTVSHCLPAIRSGSAAILKDVKAHCPEGFTQSQSELHAAICSGSLEQVRLITSDAFGVSIDDTDDKALELACHVGAIDIVDDLLTHGIKPNHLTLAHALTGGRRMLSHWLHKEEYFDSTIITHLAMAGANKQLKRKLDELQIPVTLDQTSLMGIAYAGEPECLRLILTNNKVKLNNKPNKDILNAAAASGCIANVDDLIKHHNLTPDTTTLSSAATSGNLALVQFLMEACGLTPDLNTLRHAILADSFDVTNFLLEPEKEYYQLTWQEVLVNCHAEEARLVGNTSLATCLLQCHRFIRHAIHDLEHDGEHIDIESFLDNAQEMAPTHLAAMLKHIISKPEYYNLTEENINWLKELDVVKDVLAPKEENQSNLNLSPGR